MNGWELPYSSFLLCSLPPSSRRCSPPSPPSTFPSGKALVWPSPLHGAPGCCSGTGHYGRNGGSPGGLYTHILYTFLMVLASPQSWAALLWLLALCLQWGRQTPFCNDRQTRSDWHPCFDAAWPCAVHRFVPSLLSHRRDGRRGHRQQASHCLTLPLPSPQAPPSVRRTSPHQAGGLRTATALPLCKKPSVSKLCSRLTVLQCTAFFVTQLVASPRGKA